MTEPGNEKQVEALAALAHEMWSGWMEYLFSDFRWGTIHFGVPVDSMARWQRQMNTPYSELPETEKESDRDQARKMLAIIEDYRVVVEETE